MRDAKGQGLEPEGAYSSKGMVAAPGPDTWPHGLSQPPGRVAKRQPLVGGGSSPSLRDESGRQVPGLHQRDGVHDFSLPIRARGLAQSVIIRSLPAGCGAGAPRAPRP